MNASARCLGISLALHAALVLPWFALSATAPTPQRARLVVELTGLLSQRQVAAQAAPTPAPAPTAPRPTAPQRLKLSGVPSPVQVAAQTPAEPTPATPPAPTPEPTSSAEPAPVLSQQAAQVAQTIQAHDSEADALRRYLAGLRKAIQSRLVYPEQARVGGEVGSPVIRFRLTNSGEIQPGSLSVQHSSGYALLDENALLAARASAPLAPPPRAMEVVIAVNFVREN